jgi:hypothetical protein
VLLLMKHSSTPRLVTEKMRQAARALAVSSISAGAGVGAAVMRRDFRTGAAPGTGCEAGEKGWRKMMQAMGQHPLHPPPACPIWGTSQQQLKGGDPVSHCLTVATMAQAWIVSSSAQVRAA